MARPLREKPMLKITRPTLLLDEARARANIWRMADKAGRAGAHFRPHFKTHQSLAVGGWFRECGVRMITVSSVRMARYFSASWQDITIAIPFNIHEAGRVNALPADCAINLCVMDADTVRKLGAVLLREVGVYIKVDVGYGRTGLLEDDPRLEDILGALDGSGKMSFRGFLGHAGHSYYAKSRAEISAIDTEARRVMRRLRKRYRNRYPAMRTSLGDTPCCSVADDLSGVSEWRPGNFVFYDLTQHLLGACALEDIAVAMACPVIAKHADRLVIHGGGVHFSKDSLIGDEGRAEYGWVVEQVGDGWGTPIEGLKITSLSQEHGIITGPAEVLGRYSVGDFVRVLPVHSCMTAAAMKRYRTLDGRIIPNIEAG
jgi:D-serine deaminase-like pyridoxal phosphate-dependent protein